MFLYPASIAPRQETSLQVRVKSLGMDYIESSKLVTPWSGGLARFIYIHVYIASPSDIHGPTGQYRRHGSAVEDSQHTENGQNLPFESLMQSERAMVFGG